jgi:hypothetical protein
MKVISANEGRVMDEKLFSTYSLTYSPTHSLTHLRTKSSRQVAGEGNESHAFGEGS